MLKNFFYKTFGKTFDISHIEHWDSIDTLPIYNWMKVHESGDFAYLMRSKSKVAEWELKGLEKVWRKLYENYIERFGYSESFVQIMEKKREIALLIVRQIEKNDKSMNTFITIAEKELEELEKDGTMDFYTGKSLLEKSLGFHIDIHKMSVAEYYSHFQLVKHEQAKSNSGKIS